MEIRNLKPELFRGYLVAELGGAVQADGDVTGPGWRARFVELPRAQIGRYAVPAFRIDVEGEPEPAAAVAAYLRRQAMRGGG